MHLTRKISAVNKVLKQADAHVANFQRRANISCLTNCNKCCLNPDIEGTIIEFLPVAYQLYLSNEYDNILENIDKRTDTLCVFLNPFSNNGSCSQYQSRGLICRLFGFTAKTDKTGLKGLVTCKPIKQMNDIGSIENKLHLAPEMPDYYMKLYGIDPQIAVQYFPINQAIKRALEIVLLHYRYKKKRA